MKRPNGLRVIVPGDGPAYEFYYDGKTMLELAPSAGDLAAVLAPPTVEGRCSRPTSHQSISTSDLLFADPYSVLADGKLAFTSDIGCVVGGVKTEMVAWANDDVFIQVWIGVDDKLPRRMRATYRADPLRLRHDLELTNWQLDGPVAAGAYAEGGRAAAWPCKDTDDKPPLRHEAGGPEEERQHRRQGEVTPNRNRDLHEDIFVIAAALGAVLPQSVRSGRGRSSASANKLRRRDAALPTATSHETHGRVDVACRFSCMRHRAYVNAYGGNTAHSHTQVGTEHTNMYGGKTEGEVGAGAYHTYPGGATYYHPPGAYPVYPAYHPPVAVPYYSTGCYGCAAAAGAVVGVAAGAAIASASSAAASSNAYAAGVAAGSANTAAATTGAYNAGVAAGVAAAAPSQGNYMMGLNYAALPAGAASVQKNGTTYYISGNTWFKPSFGANGVYYTVVPTP